jgi:CRISPR-associated protein Cmr4
MAEQTKGALLGLHAQTPLHPGAGTALGAVDLPVQRERHTHWPNIAGSALKGILRDAARARIAADPNLDGLDRFDDKPAEGDRPAERAPREGSQRKRADATLLLNEVFGPPAGQSAEFAGALSVTDARLLAFPVRSLKGVFAWATCPAILDRLKRDAELARIAVGWDVPPAPKENEAQAVAECPCVVGTSLVLEEFEFAVKPHKELPAADWIVKNLLPEAPHYRGTRERFARHLVVLHDDDFTHFARHATEVMARIGLDYDTKTVKGGALFYQEFLPAEALLYAVVIANPARARRGVNQTPERILDFVGRHTPTVLQVGGDETVGKGYCAVRLTAGGGA